MLSFFQGTLKKTKRRREEEEPEEEQEEEEPEQDYKDNEKNEEEISDLYAIQLEENTSDDCYASEEYESIYYLDEDSDFITSCASASLGVEVISFYMHCNFTNISQSTLKSKSSKKPNTPTIVGAPPHLPWHHPVIRPQVFFIQLL